MNRLVILDGFRGYFLLFMAVGHYNGLIGSWLGKVHHQYFGWVEDAQGFVFISGLVVGLVYGKKFLRNPTIAAIYGPVLARVRTIYSHQAGLVLLLVAAGLLLGARAAPDFGPYREAPVTFAVSSLLLMSSSANMGILPMYIFFMLAAPFAFQALHRGLLAPYFAVMALGWLAAQTNLMGLLVYQLQKVLVGHGIPAAFGLYFNLFGWQVLFFGGLFIGFRYAQNKLDLGFLRQAQFRTTFFIALAAVAALGIYDLVVELRLLGDDYSTKILIRTDRAILGFVYPIAFLIDLFAVVWLLQVGPADPLPWIRRAAGALQWLFTRPFLVLLGQHSLHVFSFHILVYYLLATVLPAAGLPTGVRALVLVLAVASLYLAAFGHRWLQERDVARRPVIVHAR
jgi:hypothetical protein